MQLKRKGKIALAAIVLVTVISFSWYIIAQEQFTGLHLQTSDNKDAYLPVFYFNNKTCGWGINNNAILPPYTGWILYLNEKAFFEDIKEEQMVCPKNFFKDILENSKAYFSKEEEMQTGVKVEEIFYITYDEINYRCEHNSYKDTSRYSMFREICQRGLLQRAISPDQFRMVVSEDETYICPTDDQAWLDHFCEAIK